MEDGGTRGSVATGVGPATLVVADAARLPRVPVGALVVSLDFELHWGVRDRCSTTGSYRANLLGARAAIPKILLLFREFDVAATWATVGFLFAGSRDELLSYWPERRPEYRKPTLDPYSEDLGVDERDDPFHFAPSLIERILATPRQEVGSHTFSHFYCLEPGQDKETFAADLASAVAIARSRGCKLTSLVFPRNQVNPEYLDVLPQLGFTSYRASQPGWAHRPGADATVMRRAAWLADSYAGRSKRRLVDWRTVPAARGLANVRAGHFLRPYDPRYGRLEGRRLATVRRQLRAAAEERRILHLWWHPHNFGAHLEANLDGLRQLLEEFADLRERHGMMSLCMRDVAAICR